MTTAASTKRYYRKSVKGLNKEVENLNKLKADIEDFIESKNYSVITLESFHLVAAAQTLRNGIPVLLKGLRKNIAWYKQRLR